MTKQVITLHREEDAFGSLSVTEEVIQNDTIRCLTFGSDVEQSRLYLNAPMRLPFEYQQVIEARLLEHHQPHPVQCVLMLGMGGGSIAKQLHTLLPNTAIHIVELRQAVIDIAYHYFQLPDVPEIEAIQEDALVFIQDAHARYDVIIVDVFDSFGVPTPFTSVTFQENLSKNLKRNGLILFNLWDNQAHKAQQNTQKVIDYWHVQSASNNITVNTYLIPSTENIILSIQN